MKYALKRKVVAFTITELLVVVAVISLLCFVASSALARATAKTVRMSCANNLRQIAIACKIWEGGNGHFFPQAYAGLAQYPIINSPSPGGAQGSFWPSPGGVCPSMYTVFLQMSNELSSPQIIACPSDSIATPATNFGASMIQFKNSATSYFIGENASEASPRMFLAGDRNISSDTTTFAAQPYGYSSTSSSGKVAAIGTNSSAAPLNGANFGWTSKMHKSVGNVAFVDGSVQRFNNAALIQAFSQTGDTNSLNKNVLLFP